MGILLNWIAQGVMVAAAVGAGLWLMPPGRAGARVRVWWTAIAAVMAVPLVSWLSAAALPGPPASGFRLPVSGVAPGVMTPLVVVPQSVWNATAVAAALWIAWICVQSLRLWLDLRALLRVRRDCRPVTALVAGRLRPSTRARLAKSNARLMESEDVRAAAVLGFGPPIIAVQPVLLLHLTDAELDQVVIHEWAHVARRDFLGTLVQRIVHVLAGWHPAVRFATSRLRMEREMACDEVVVDATGSAKAYAACLTRVAGVAQTSRGSHLAVAMLSSSGLTRRVLRLLARRRTPAFAPQWMMAPAALAVVVAFCSGQVSLFGLRIAPLAMVDAQIVAVASPVALRAGDAVPTARTPKATKTRTAEREAAPLTPAPTAVPSATAESAGATAVIEPAEEPAPLPVASSAIPAIAAAHPPAVAPGAGAQSTTVSGEARQAWAAATRAGESIVLSSRNGAVETAGFFTRLSKKVATSF